MVFIMKQIFIITGVFGHLGNTIAKMLLADGQTVRGLAMPNDETEPFVDMTNLQIYRGDVCDKNSLLPIFSNTEGAKLTVIHTAGLISITAYTSPKLREVNVRGTQNIINLCKKFYVKKLVYVSSVHAIKTLPNDEIMVEPAVFDPTEILGGYAKTKTEATRRVLLAATEGLNAVVVFPSGIIGPNDYRSSHLTQLIIDFLDKKLTACVEGGYDFVDVRDVAFGCLMAAQNGEAGDTYILSGTKCTAKQLLDILSLVATVKQIKRVLPMAFAKTVAPLSEYYYKLRNQPPLYTTYSLQTLCANSNFSHEKATVQLGYQPRPMEQTITDTVRWLQENERFAKYKNN